MRTFLTSIAILSAAYTAAAESTPVTGIIVDEKGEPLIGVTVKVNGAPIGTSTDLDGKFSIILPKAKGELTFSYVGYSTFTKKVTDGENLATIKMEPTTGNLDEVVVIGYGVAKKSSLTSSVEVISGDELTKIPAMNVDQALAGTMPGLG
ncbi:MAG: carboxypeptidase-like regulatory domain-containing protein, partial [Muribaculaceae bacterium]|nr:carboxypeptidase-like regulatory domain-containing protein [Muribaculaceae bacterium]